MKRILAILLVLCLMAGLAGCGGSGDAYVPTGDGLTWDEDYTGPTYAPPGSAEEQKLTLTWYPDRSMNPYICTDFTNQALFSLVYQGLFATDRNYNVEPVLCKSFRMSKDMKTYTFYPETNATFSDGSRLTAQDVLDSLLAAKNSVSYSGRFFHVDNILLSQDGGVTVIMDTAYENLPILLDVPILKSTQLQEDIPVGTGPYRMEGSGASAVLRRRTDWWCKAVMTVTAPVISLLVAESATQIRDTFEFEDLDLVYADPGSDRYADYRCDYEVWDSENGIFLFLACNMNIGVFTDPAIRAALPKAVDRDTLAATHYRGFARTATLPASPQSPYYNQTLASRYAYDGGAALKQAYADAQLPPETVVKLLVNVDDSLRTRVARDIADQLRECGMTVEIVALDSENYRYYLRMGWFDLYLGQTKLSPNMDLTPFFHRNGATSWGGVDSVSLYTLCLDSLANHGNFYTLHQNVMDDGRLCPILFRSYAVYATRGLLTSLTPSRDNVFYYSLGRTMEKAQLKDEA